MKKIKKNERWKEKNQKKEANETKGTKSDGK